MPFYRHWIIIVLLLLLGCGGWAIWNASRKTPSSVHHIAGPESVPANSMVGQSVSFTITEGASKKWRLEAAQAVYNQTRTEAWLTAVHGEFYDKNGKPVLHFEAPKGHFTSKDSAVKLTGGVIAESTQTMGSGGKGGTLKAPVMVWSGKSNRVTATGGTVLNLPQGTSTANTCQFTLDFSDVALSGNVSSVLANM